MSTHPPVAGATGIMYRLREHTAAQHAHAESRPLEQAMFKGLLPKEIYVAWLGQRLMMHRALEAAARRLLDSDARVRPILSTDLFQEPNLVADLRHLGVDPESVPPCESAERFALDVTETEQRLPAAVLGHYYVFEGSKNGARMLARVAGRAYQLTSDAGMRYLDPHGDQQRPLWMQFKAAMDAADFTEAELDAMVAAAGRTFDFVSGVDDELYAGAPAR